MKNFHKLVSILTLLALLLAGMPMQSARATSSTITVDSIADTTLDDGTCTLREAITNANGDSQLYATAGECSAGSGTDAITFSVSGMIILGGYLPITDTDGLSIDGSGQSITISGNDATLILIVYPGIAASLNALTIANGKAVTNAGISNEGILTISNSTFSNNKATVGGAGGIYNVAGATLTVYNSAFSNNTASGISGIGGGIYNESTATLTIYNSTFSGNSAGWGSDIYNQGTLNMTNTILANSGGSEDCYNDSSDVIATNTNNLIETNGPSGHMCGTPALTGDPMLGALADNGGPTQTFAMQPGSPAIDTGDKATCNASPVSNLDQRGFSRNGTSCDIGSYERVFRYVATTGDNTSNDCLNSAFPCQTVHYAITQAKQGDVISIAAGTYAENNIFFNDLEAIGAGMNQTILDGGGINTVVQVSSGMAASLADLTIQNGGNNTYGGGINSSGILTLKRVKVTGNHVTWEGGGISTYSALTMIDSVVSANTADVAGGGIYINTTATVNLTNVTISGNTATGSYGGGMYQENTPTTNLTNVTISGNTSSLGGGGISTSGDGGTLNILNSTIANNHVTSDTVGGIRDLSTLNIKNTIVAGNDGDECVPGGAWNSQGYNLSSDATCSFTNTGDGDQQNTDPLLGALANNGGYSQTHALLSGSPAINAGTNTDCPSKDQRGIKRPQGAVCDIGAYEANQIVAFNSTGSQDGWVLETGEKTTKGGKLDSKSTTFRLGDDKTKKQYRGILSFKTSSLSDTAVITKVTLKVRKQGITGGGNPVTIFKGFMADIKKGFIGTSASLQAADFQTAASKTYGPFKTVISGVWYNIDLTSGKSYINKTSASSGLTQIRLRFYLDDNNNTTANYLSLYSGSTTTVANLPQLVIEYYVP